MNGNKQAIITLTVISVILGVAKMGGAPISWFVVTIPIVAPLFVLIAGTLLGAIIVFLSSLYHSHTKK
jgi:hypothetical protein